MKLPHSHRNGFTLIELMVVVGILALISGIMIPSFSNYTRNQSLKQAQENFKSDLRSIQNRALTGTGSDKTYGTTPPLPALYWAISYTAGAGSYSVYLTHRNDCSTPVIESQTFNLPSNITFNSSGCLLFSLEDGSVYTTGGGSINTVNISLKHSASSTLKTVTVNRPGLIFSDN